MERPWVMGWWWGWLGTRDHGGGGGGGDVRGQRGPGGGNGDLMVGTLRVVMMEGRWVMGMVGDPGPMGSVEVVGTVGT